MAEKGDAFHQSTRNVTIQLRPGNHERCMSCPETIRKIGELSMFQVHEKLPQDEISASNAGAQYKIEPQNTMNSSQQS